MGLGIVLEKVAAIKKSGVNLMFLQHEIWCVCNKIILKLLAFGKAVVLMTNPGSPQLGFQRVKPRLYNVITNHYTKVLET